VGYFLSGPFFTADPAYLQAVPYPLHPYLQPVAHSLWDGGLFLIGVAWLRRWRGVAAFSRFHFGELALFVLYGNLQEILVELIATSSGLWTFTASPHNPVLFPFGMGVITLGPQLVWTAATLLYYPACVRLHRASPGRLL
jgi:hypothetical protein